MKRLSLLASLVAAFGLLMAGLSAPTSVGAEGPASSVSTAGSASGTSQFLGFVFVEPGEPVPTTVRAMGAAGVVCGTGEVRVVAEDLGFYNITVVGQSSRTGCPRPGGSVSLWLLYGSVDAGVPATPNVQDGPNSPLVFRPGEASVVSIGTPGSFGSEGWSGAAPAAGGVAILRWNGPDGVPASAALSLLSADLRGAWHYDAASGNTLTYVPDAPSFVQTYTRVAFGDIVVVRAR